VFVLKVESNETKVEDQSREHVLGIEQFHCVPAFPVLNRPSKITTKFVVKKICDVFPGMLSVL